jgi:hypothetical protein|tara:strand:- start:300 stop:515 length:216 start_codon:yes stop_codon:yes gene_type:complete
MEKIKLVKDVVGGTLTIWFGNPDDEYICEEAGDGIVLMKDASGKVIGFEYLYYGSESEDLNIETLIAKTAS